MAVKVDQNLVKAIRELEDWYDEAVKQIMDNPFITKKPHLFMPIPRSTLMIERLKLKKLEMYQQIIKHYQSKL